MDQKRFYDSPTSHEIGSLKTVNLNVLYKHIKHNVIPGSTIESGMEIMSRFEHIAITGECRKLEDKLLQAKVYGRLAELNRQVTIKGLKRRDQRDLSSIGRVFDHFVQNSELTMDQYQKALQRMSEVLKEEPMITNFNRKYRVVHRLATFALDCVEYCRECRRDKILEPTLRQAHSEPDLDNLRRGAFSVFHTHVLKINLSHSDFFHNFTPLKPRS